MALEAVPDCGAVDLAFDLAGVLIAVALETELNGCGCDQLNARDISVDPNLVAARAAHGNRRMHGFALCLVLVTLKALRWVSVLVEWNRMDLGQRGCD